MDHNEFNNITFEKSKELSMVICNYLDKDPSLNDQLKCYILENVCLTVLATMIASNDDPTFTDNVLCSLNDYAEKFKKNGNKNV